MGEVPQGHNNTGLETPLSPETVPGPRIEQCPQPYGYILSDQSTLLVLSQTEPAHRELEQEGK